MKFAEENVINFLNTFSHLRHFPLVYICIQFKNQSSKFESMLDSKFFN